MTKSEEKIRYDSVVPLEDLTISDIELKHWKSLPESIRNDVCFEAYRKENLMTTGKFNSTEMYFVVEM